jgi:CHASE2 domain-containing sensor protein
LGLWSALISNRRRDPQLLSVSTGLGIAVTGAAISYGVRGYFSRSWIWVPDVFMSATFVVCMFIWCYAFRSKRVQTAAL